MKYIPLFLIGLATVASAALPTNARVDEPKKAAIGEVTPSWSLTDSNGKPQAIEDYRGKFVVLEWTNNQCPFVRKHYESGNMQDTQAKAKEMGAVWLTVISSAPGKQGYMTP